ncbi:hypothetical protein R2F25_38905 [Streptomyces sp. UP1A-1]|nr:hypothetical protein [Streptomyces sp. UP1A-1]
MGKSGRGLIPQAGDDAETVLALAMKRTTRYLTEVRKRYPDGFTQLNRMVRQKGAPGMLRPGRTGAGFRWVRRMRWSQGEAPTGSRLATPVRRIWGVSAPWQRGA